MKRKEYIRDYFKIIDDLINKFNNYECFYKLDSILCNDLINRLEYARKTYKQINKYKWDFENYESIYICRMLLERDITYTSRDETIVLIKKKDNIVAFGKSRKESIKNCKELFKNFLLNSKNAQKVPLENLLAQHEIDSLIKKAKYDAHIISP